MPTATGSFLHVVERCDNFNLVAHRDELALFCLSGDPGSLAAPVGLLWPEIIRALEEDNTIAKSEGREPSWVLLTSYLSAKSDVGHGEERGGKRVTHVHFAPHLSDRTLRSAAIETTCTRWRDASIFPETIGGRQWRNELYPIYASPFCGLTAENVACTIERSAAALFGIVTYGVHMTVFQRPPPSSKGELMIWVPTRAKTKPTWPGLLDNTVAGGIPAGMPPFEALVKECMEEASLTEDIVRTHARCVGAVSYFFQKGRWLQPEVEYVYDLEIPSTASQEEFSSKYTPRLHDDEVEAFEFLPLSEVISRIHQGLFKPNCALVLIDFFIRHGYITPESEPNYVEIITRLHGRFDYTLWAR